MSELNREQIIKQMQEWHDNMCENACLKGESLKGKVHTCEICFPNTVKNALALIKSQEQSIKELTEDAANWRIDAENYRNELEELKKVKYIFSTVDYCADDLAKALEENKRLERERDSAIVAAKMAGVPFPEGLQIVHDFCEKRKREAEADTVRKMQERLTMEFDRLHKNNFMTLEVRQWIIDQIAKEMLEGKK